MIRTAFVLLFAGGLCAQPPATPLWLRGHAVIPTPQRVTLESGDVVFDASWTYRVEGAGPTSIAVRTLLKDLREFHSIELASGSTARSILLAVRKGTVSPPAGDAAIDAQGYKLRISTSAIEVTGNGEPGLLYGVQTLLQLLKPGPRGSLVLPLATIEDWPKLQLRFLHWDTKHHQDRMETLKRYLDWSVRFKANMIGFELEDKFAYPSLPGVAAPGAFTSAELQEIVNYGLDRFIQVVPVIQAPAHLAYVLKYPQFAHLRADGNNYQACLCDEDAYRLIFKMYDDVIQATKGVDYLFASTDEVYYAGNCAKCSRPYTPENRSLEWAEFARRAHDHLASRGRRMLAWLEYPLLAEHLNMIPSSVIDGVIGEAEYIPIEKRKGMRQLAYVSLQGAEFLFPDHFASEPDLRDPPSPGAEDPLEFERGLSNGRLRSVHDQIANGRVWQANPIGVFGAAWDDSGSHNETFWIGWAAAARYGWQPGTPSPEQHAAEFMNVYYGPGTTGMIEVYRGLQRQARSWQRTWERVVSRVRRPGYGNSDGKGIGTKRYDQTLTLPPIPRMPKLAFTPAFVKRHERFLALAQARSLENDQLLHAIHDNIGRAGRNRYNLEVMLALTDFTGHHWRLLFTLADAERSLDRARVAAGKNDPKQAVGLMVDAYNKTGTTETEGKTTFERLVAVFTKSQYAKGRTVDGKAFVQVLDDTKDHWAGRTADWGYMFAPEQSMGLVQWRKELRGRIEAYAKLNKVPVEGLAEARLEE